MVILYHSVEAEQLNNPRTVVLGQQDGRHFMRLQLCSSCGAHWGVKKEVE